MPSLVVSFHLTEVEYKGSSIKNFIDLHSAVSAAVEQLPETGKVTPEGTVSRIYVDIAQAVGSEVVTSDKVKV